jgi:hypothetical protein
MNPSVISAQWVFLALILPRFVFANPLESWAKRVSRPDYSLAGCGFGAGRFVAVGTGGAVNVSTNGLMWFDAKAPTTNNLTAVAHGNGNFIAVGANGTIVTSTNGSVWRIQNSGVSNSLAAVTYSAGLFVAVGAGGAIVTSPDGMNWTTRSSGTTSDLFAIAFGNGTFVALGKFTGVSVTSGNGVNWTSDSFPAAAVLNCLAFGNNAFVAGGDNGLIYRSFNGGTWNSVGGTAGYWYAGTFGCGVFVLVGWPGRFAVSSDGATWSVGNLGVDAVFDGVAYGNGLFVARASSPHVLATSPNGSSWTDRSSAAPICLHCAAHGAGIFIAAGEDGNIFVSSNTGNWLRPVSGTPAPLRGMTYGDNRFVAVGYGALPGSVLVTSTNGLDWSATSGGLPYGLTAVAYGNGQFVAVADFDGRAVISTNGSGWIGAALGTNTGFYGITYGKGLFLAVGDGGDIRTSPDGQGWTRRDSGAPSNTRLLAATYDDVLKLFVVVGALSFSGGGIILASSNAANWTTVSFGVFKPLRALAASAGILVAVGDGGTIVSSVDGVHWAARPSGTGTYLNGITSGLNTFLAAGENNIILQSAVLVPFSLRFPPGTPGAGLTVTLSRGTVFRIEATTDFVSWTQLFASNNSYAQSEFIDTGASNYSMRFYRLILP